MNIYTVSCDYVATGEGRTIMALIGQFQNKHGAVREFEKLFGSWYTIGVEVAEGIDTAFSGAHLLLPTLLVNQIEGWALDDKGPYFNWHSHLHFNYS